MSSEPKSADPVMAEFQLWFSSVRAAARAEGAEAERWQGTERVRRAVQNERKRYLEILAKTANRTTVAEVSTRKYLTECRDAVCQPEPPPPAEEPMTIAKILAKIRGGPMVWQHGTDSERDLLRLVQAQARRDARICEAKANVARGMSTHRAVNEMKILHYMDCHDAILKAAGLE